jgi:hypothetical protein
MKDDNRTYSLRWIENAHRQEEWCEDLFEQRERTIMGDERVMKYYDNGTYQLWWTKNLQHRQEERCENLKEDKREMKDDNRTYSLRWIENAHR